MFASATGDAFPGTIAAPPMITTRLTQFATRRFHSRSASAIFVNGPMGTRVISPGLARVISTIISAAVWSTIFPFGSGTTASPMPFLP